MPMATNMSHVVQLVPPLTQFVATPSRPLSWNHFVNLQQMHKDGDTVAAYWTEIPPKAVLCAVAKTRELCARTVAQRKLPVENRLSSGDLDPTGNKIKVMAIKVSKGLEFPALVLPGVGHMPATGEDEKEAARVFYVAASLATQKLMIAASGDGKFVGLVFHRRGTPIINRHDGKTKITFKGRSSI